MKSWAFYLRVSLSVCSERVLNLCEKLVKQAKLLIVYPPALVYVVHPNPRDCEHWKLEDEQQHPTILS